MIFSNKIYKISSGKNLSIFAEDKSTMNLYLYNDKLKKRKINLSELVRCLNTSTKLEGIFTKKINLNHTLICHDDNYSIINNNDEN